ncbi:tail fiber assembly protein [Escherichia coli]
MGMATDAESATLPLWKQYRVLLSRIDANTDAEISWPITP